MPIDEEHAGESHIPLPLYAYDLDDEVLTALLPALERQLRSMDPDDDPDTFNLLQEAGKVIAAEAWVRGLVYTKEQ